MKTLHDYLGTWVRIKRDNPEQYEVANSNIYIVELFEVTSLQNPECFVIQWDYLQWYGVPTDIEISQMQIDDPIKNNQIYIYSADETYRRILAKARMGYKHVRPFSMPASTVLSRTPVDDIDEVLAEEKRKFIKRQPRVKKISVLEWIAGMSAHRENTEFDTN